MGESIAISYLLEIAPVLAVTATVIFYLYRMYIFERKQNLNIEQKFRESEKENLEILRNLSEFVNRMYEHSQTHHAAMSLDLSNRTAEIKTHMDSRIERLELSLKGSFRHDGTNSK